MSGTETSEVVDSDVEEDFVISRPIQDVINRYEERVDEIKEEHDFLSLIKAESLKRQMTLYPSLELVKHQVCYLFLILITHFRRKESVFLALIHFCRLKT